MEGAKVESGSWHTYPSIFALGHRAIEELLFDPVLVEEKIDGSQFSFGFFSGYPKGHWRMRSKGADINLDAPEKMFAPAVEFVRSLPVVVEWTYRAEYLSKPKHNVLAYDRTPRGGLILFDINTGHETYLGWDAKVAEAERLGLEVVPRIFEGRVADLTQLQTWMATVSVLGGQTVEGLVFKNYYRFGRDAKVLMGKFVSEAFKEIHKGEWRRMNPNSADILDRLWAEYRTPARWAKALQHLGEAGKIEGSPRDIGLLIREVPTDVEKECAEEIKEALYAWAWPKLRRGLTSGLAEWYKGKLAEQQQFAGEGGGGE